MNSGQKITGELVISRGDAPEVLEPAKAAFDDISSFVGAFVEAMDDDTVRFIGDYGLGATTNDFAAKLVAIIPFVGEEHAHGWRERQDIGAAAISASWPGVRCRTTGRQSGSLSAWIFVVRPPRERPIA
uniref:Uncharacterized protein n=1 Tax=Bradyrhizobium diazoefficiens TaxID=1355477 RepID=A0A809YGG3_9BRAD|nr:hypothetical protein XF2B_18040 [Bradyrhizobium diazoefficiens]BCE36771.1 hypothetical protein XF3B_18020 [Bradyrhizobium diazoefficiens]BCE71704.1 hypothetical protein XF8B_18150 [Bradyrhizobium diazoefficiens]BCE80371.1 hypothetical protein XF9B_17920 [Bradyrhizobium diazoefficiens]BCE97781.1 hypothetical protein XF11B_18020 [Bradyrhizobium diazoefficiens]